jgi:hypothetical protein
VLDPAVKWVRSRATRVVDALASLLVFYTAHWIAVLRPILLVFAPLTPMLTALYSFGYTMATGVGVRVLRVASVVGSRVMALATTFASTPLFAAFARVAGACVSAGERVWRLVLVIGSAFAALAAAVAAVFSAMLAPFRVVGSTLARVAAAVARNDGVQRLIRCSDRVTALCGRVGAVFWTAVEKVRASPIINWSDQTRVVRDALKQLLQSVVNSVVFLFRIGKKRRGVQKLKRAVAAGDEDFEAVDTIAPASEFDVDVDVADVTDSSATTGVYRSPGGSELRQRKNLILNADALETS